MPGAAPDEDVSRIPAHAHGAAGDEPGHAADGNARQEHGTLERERRKEHGQRRADRESRRAECQGRSTERPFPPRTNRTGDRRDHAQGADGEGDGPDGV